MFDLINQRLEGYDLTSDRLRDQALREIVQEIALYGLSKSDFFDYALFHGGTSLRIVHKIPRFSEDLDFMLRKSNPDFPWQKYVDQLERTFKLFGFDCEIQTKGKLDSNVRKAVLKDNSITRQINLSFDNRDPGQKMRIKLEIDIHPPLYSGEAETTLTFPQPHRIRHQDIESNFALKISAMLCRMYTKGRDWYDFVWYVSNRVQPNIAHLKASLVQNGRWFDKESDVLGPDWLEQEIMRTVKKIDWERAIDEISAFVSDQELSSFDNWGENFFKKQIAKFIDNLD